MNRVTIWKGGQGSCIFNSWIEKGVPVGVICIYVEPGEIPSSSQHLRAARFKRGQGTCSFNCCDEELKFIRFSISTTETFWNSLSNTTVKDTGAPSSFPDGHPIHAAPGEIPSSSQQWKLQEPYPLSDLVTLVELLQLSLLVTKGEFHQVLHGYKWHLVKFPVLYNC